MNSYETVDGTLREEQGEQREIGGEAGTVVHGRYAYKDNGVLYSVTYTSDENGFVPVGEHIPTSPVPWPIVNAPEEPSHPIENPTIENRLPEEVRASIQLSDETQSFGPIPHASSPSLPVNDVPIVRSLIDHTEHDSGLVRSETVINPDGSYHYRYVKGCL